MATARQGIYPGSFNPPTKAHLAVAAAALRAHRLDRVDWTVSRRALEKENVERPLFEDRINVLRQIATARDWLGVVVTDRQLLVDMAEGYDVLILGADKWHQVLDPRYYGDSESARDDAVARLPRLAIAPRPPLSVPAEYLLDVDQAYGEMSSTAARAGAIDLMADEAAAFDRATGAWTDPERYERWLAERTS